MQRYSLEMFTCAKCAKKFRFAKHGHNAINTNRKRPN
jgi:hypothetical protein